MLVREPRQEGANTLLVLLHGLGSNEHDLMQLADELDSRFKVATLRAPVEYAVGGYSWFPLEWDAAGIRIRPSDVLSSVEQLAERLHAVCTTYRPERLILGGFSQGAIMTVGVAALAPELLQGAISMSGRFVPELLDGKDPSAVPFLVQHGLYDQILDPEGSRRLTATLRGLGATVEAHEYPMGHEVSWKSLQDLSVWLNQFL